MKILTRTVALVFALGMAFAQEPVTQESPPVTIVGYVRDSGCVHRFHEVVKPLPNGCVEACARGGSALVLLTKDEHVYHPISAEMPDVDVRPKLLPFLGQLVKISGHIYARGDSRAISLEKIQAVAE
jgi:hypothetical protein